MNKGEFDFGRLVTTKIEGLAREYPLREIIYEKGSELERVSLAQMEQRESEDSGLYVIADRRFHRDGYIRTDVIVFEDKEGVIVKRIKNESNHIIPDKNKLFHIDFCGYSGRDTNYRWGGCFSGAKIKGIGSSGVLEIPVEEAARLLSLLGEL